jgi:hypothetical protein
VRDQAGVAGEVVQLEHDGRLGRECAIVGPPSVHPGALSVPGVRPCPVRARRASFRRARPRWVGSSRRPPPSGRICAEATPGNTP